VLWARCRLISTAEGQEMEDKLLGSPSPEIYQITHLGSEKEICRMWFSQKQKSLMFPAAGLVYAQWQVELSHLEWPDGGNAIF
jgi:hypothetical protein